MLSARHKSGPVSEGSGAKKRAHIQWEPAKQLMPKVRAGQSWPGSAGVRWGVSSSKAWAVDLGVGGVFLE